MPTDKPLRVKAVAEFFSVTQYTVREWLKAGDMKGFKINGQWRVLQSERDAYAQRTYGSQT